MPRSLFRIDSVAIEGFKAFTKRQDFDFGGRNVFLFGPNGLGKTSIVEAIRWCLFGLASRAGEIIKNQFYDGPCIVQMTLRGPDGHWTMQRRLRPSGGESDLTIRDPNGRDRNLEDVFPQLNRVGPMQGAHVIYAAQQPSSRRPAANITDFSYVVFSYLGIEEVPRLIDVLLELSNDWQAQEKELSAEVDSLGDKFSQRIVEVEESLGQITSNPPWGTTLTPTNSDTRNKIDNLAKEAEALGAQCSSDTLDGLALSEKLYELETAVSTVLSGELGGLKQKLVEKSSLLQEAEDLHKAGQTAEQEIQEQSSGAATVRGKLASVLNDATIEELEAQLQQVEGDFERAQRSLDVVRSSLKYMKVVENGTPQDVCPACGKPVEVGQFKLHLEEVESSGDSDTKEFLEHRDRLRERISKAKDLSNREADLTAGIAQNRCTLDAILGQASKSKQKTRTAFTSIGRVDWQIRPRAP